MAKNRSDNSAANRERRRVKVEAERRRREKRLALGKIIARGRARQVRRQWLQKP